MAVLVYGIKILMIMRLDGHQLLAGEEEGRDYQILCCTDSPQTVVCKWLTVTVAINLMIDDSSSGDEELTIPTGANVQFSVNEGTLCLQIRTWYTSSWTPIALRTRSKC